MLSDDAARFDRLGQLVASGAGLVDMVNPAVNDREPLYPLFLGGVYTLFGHHPQTALFIQSALVVAALIFFFSALWPFTGGTAAIFVILLTSLMPGVAAYTAGSLLSEAMGFALALSTGAVFFIASRKYSVVLYAVSGVFAGALALTRFPYLLFPLGLALAIAVFHPRGVSTQPYRFAAALAIGALIPILLWTARNWIVTGIPSPTGTKGGSELYLRVQNGTFNISAGKRARLVAVAKLIRTAMGASSRILFSKNRSGEITHFSGNIAKASRLLGYAPRVSIREGIRHAVAWYTS